MNKKVIKQCKVCKKDFESYIFRNRKYCSNKCRFTSRIGMKFKPETIHKLSISHLGKINWSSPQEHPMWKGGLPKCSICSEIITYGKNKCRRCCRRGSLHHLWKGGVVSLQHKIRRSIEFKEWRDKIFHRDGYECQQCHIKNGLGKSINLHPHHIKRFREIFTDFLKYYSQFSPIEDKETLSRLAITYEPFWDILNGITLCRDCHFKIHFDEKTKRQMAQERLR